MVEVRVFRTPLPCSKVIPQPVVRPGVELGNDHSPRTHHAPELSPELLLRLMRKLVDEARGVHRVERSVREGQPARIPQDEPGPVVVAGTVLRCLREHRVGRVESEESIRRFGLRKVPETRTRPTADLQDVQWALPERVSQDREERVVSKRAIAVHVRVAVPALLIAIARRVVEAASRCRRRGHVRLRQACALR